MKILLIWIEEAPSIKSKPILERRFLTTTHRLTTTLDRRLQSIKLCMFRLLLGHLRKSLLRRVNKNRKGKSNLKGLKIFTWTKMKKSSILKPNHTFRIETSLNLLICHKTCQINSEIKSLNTKHRFWGTINFRKNSWRINPWRKETLRNEIKHPFQSRILCQKRRLLNNPKSL